MIKKKFLQLFLQFYSFSCPMGIFHIWKGQPVPKLATRPLHTTFSLLKELTVDLFWCFLFVLFQPG